MFPSTVVQVDTEHDKIVTLEKRIQTLQQQLAHGVNIGHFISTLHGFMVLCCVVFYGVVLCSPI